MENSIIKIDDEKLNELIENRLENLHDNINAFNDKYVNRTYDKYGNEYKETNPLAIANFFFNSLSTTSYAEVEYSTQQLDRVWKLYLEILNAINMEIDVFPPTLSSFCRFSGISMTKMQEYKATATGNFKNIIENIHSEIYDNNIMLAQAKKIQYRATENRMKVENQVVEKKAPNVNLNIGLKDFDLEKINSRLTEIQYVTNKKIDYEGK